MKLLAAEEVDLQKSVWDMSSAIEQMRPVGQTLLSSSAPRLVVKKIVATLLPVLKIVIFGLIQSPLKLTKNTYAVTFVIS